MDMLNIIDEYYYIFLAELHGYLKECVISWQRKVGSRDTFEFRSRIDISTASFIGGEDQVTAADLNKYFANA